MCEILANKNKEEVEILCKSLSEKYKEYNDYIDSLIKERSVVEFPLTLQELRLIYNKIIFGIKPIEENDKELYSQLIIRMEKILSID